VGSQENKTVVAIIGIKFTQFGFDIFPFQQSLAVNLIKIDSGFSCGSDVEFDVEFDVAEDPDTSSLFLGNRIFIFNSFN
jgi:hypothetical protein